MTDFSERGSEIAKIETIKTIIWLILLLGLLLFNINFNVYKVNGSSMEPILTHGEYGIAKKKPNKIDVGDIIIFNNNSEKAIKYVAAKEGDVVEYKKGLLFVNGEEQPDMSNMETDAHLDAIKFQLQPDEYWVIGFNLEPYMSYDSRTHGVVKEDNIYGKVIYPNKNPRILEELQHRVKMYELNNNK